MKQIADDHFGLLLWDEDYGEWQGTTTLSPHGEVDVGLPPEYIEAADIRQHILATIDVIKRDELALRQKAAHDLFTDDEQFANGMHLSVITFCLYCEDMPLTLSYNYGEEGVEHGILIYLTWNGDYQYARTY